MADTAITITALDKSVPYRQVQMPSYMTGTFAGDDVDYHSFVIDGRGKGNLTVAVHNLTDQTVTVSLYGMHSIDGVVGGTGVFSISAAGFTVATDTTGYKVNTDPFPYFLVRLTFAGVPDGKDVTTWANLSAY